MIGPLRASFNSRWTAEGYAKLLGLLEQRCGLPVPFRINETPCFFPRTLIDRLAADGAELIRQLCTPAYHATSERSLPDRYRVPNEPAHPMFVQVDFGLVRSATGELDPKLVEIQGFPSLYAFQPVLAQAYMDAYGLSGLSYVLVDNYEERLRRAIVGGQNPEDVVLLELEPDKQKTRVDFVLTERILGIRAVCITEVRKEGNALYHGGRRIRRIYNRAIVDELERRGAEIGFDWRDDLDVEWAGHPNHYFRISKFSIPYLQHPSVPRTWFLHEMVRTPDDLENFVLKPLYSFAGLGVVIGPTATEIAAVRDPENWILQERIHFEPVIETPQGRTKAEIRVMYLWPSDGPLEAVCTIVRTGRGKMMGVDHNKGKEWVGASAALF